MNPGKILLVDDDLFLREIYLDILKESGLSAETAVDGEDAYNKIKQGGWDLVLLDFVLPKMNGLEVMKKIKSSQDPKPAKKIIFLTNIDDTKDLDQLKELGDGYLIKSELTPVQFVDKVKSYLH